MTKIISTNVAYETFQACRSLMGMLPGIFEIVIPVLEMVKRQKTIVVDIPSSILNNLSPELRQNYKIRPGKEKGLISIGDSIENPPPQPEGIIYGFYPIGEDEKQLEGDIPDKGMELVDLSLIAALELKDLFAKEAYGPIRSLGYAMHIVPGLFRNGALDPGGFEFNLRIIAFFWEEYSMEMRLALAKTTQYGLAEIDELSQDQNFVVDMYGYSPK